MHEAGLAMAVAEALRDERRAGDRVRLLVAGGHGRPEEFDASLRLHLALADPALDPTELEIVHLPTDRLCVGCGRSFRALAADEPCPTCGSAGLAVPGPERIDLQLVHPGAGGP
jgi:Zn finger protein HypA/HybF involved in hydrogenase expression